MKTSMYKRGIARALLAMLLVGSGGAFAATAATEDQSGTSVTTFTLTSVDANGAYAAGATVTAAGSTVENDATLAYSVGGTEQDGIAASDSGGSASFVVDRLVDVNVTETATLVSGAGQDAHLSFDVRNESNEDLDLLLRLEQLAGINPGSVAGTEITPTVQAVCVDNASGGGSLNGVCGDAEDQALSVTGDNASVYVLPSDIQGPGTAVRVLVQLDLGAAVSTDWATYALAAAVSDVSGGTSNDADRISNDSNGRTSPDGTASDVADDAATKDDVFGDGAGSDAVNFSDGTTSAPGQAFDGQLSARQQIEVNSADLTITKESTVIYDPINGLGFPLDSQLVDGTQVASLGTTASGSNPKRIPGAIVRYTITVENAGTAGASATGVTITDDVPAEVTNGNDETFTNLDTSAGSTGLSGNGAAVSNSAGADTAGTYLDQVIVSGCAASPTPTTAGTFANLEGSGIPVGTCAPGDTGTIVYFVTIP